MSEGRISPMPPAKPVKLRGLDPGIAPYVALLRQAGFYTIESCQGGKGHAFPVPTIRFAGNPAMGMVALAVALYHVLPVAELRRVWRLSDGEVEGPFWDMTFRLGRP